MPKPPYQIQQELEAIEADIPQFIKTGIPKNVKSDKHRSLEERANIADQDLLEHIIAFYDNMGMVMYSPGDPNENPPTEDYDIGQLYVQTNQSTGDLMNLFIYTGLDSLGWWKFQNFEADTATKYYGTIESPNEEPIPNLPSVNPFKIGDFYIRTSTGTADGNVLDVWLFLGLATGDQWINLLAGSGGVDQFKELTDVPDDYIGHSKKIVRVKEDETGLEFHQPKSVDTPTGISVDGGVTLSDFGGAPVNGQLYRTGNVLKFKDGSGNVHILNDEKLIIPISPFDEDIEVMDCQPISFTFPFEIVDANIGVGTAPSGADINVGIKKNATDVTPSTRITIPNGSINSMGATPPVFTSTSFAVGDIFKPYIAQVGSTTPGKDLNLILTIRKL